MTTNTWWVVTGVLFVLFSAILFIVFSPEINDWYLAEFVGPKLEERYGFRGGMVAVRWNGRAYEMYGITGVTPGGPFALAGVEPGDIPTGFVHGHRAGFLSKLQNASGPEVQLRFEPAASFEEAHRQVKTISVRVRGEAPAN